MDATRKKILITGCGGMTGAAFYQTFSEEYEVLATDIDVNEPWLSYLDVRDYPAAKDIIARFDPDCIINLAALTDLEYCEVNEEECLDTNSRAAENIALISRELDRPLVYLSSAGVFDGKRETYGDDDQPKPISTYGKSKYYGELAVEKHCTRFYIFRCGWMMGGGQKDKKFVGKIMRQILAGKKELNVVGDLFGSPTYTTDLARNIMRIVQATCYGHYNLSCEGRTTRYEIAEAILAELDLTRSIRLNEVDSTFFSKEYYAPRPVSEALECAKLKNRNLYFMRDWKAALKEYLAEAWKDKLTTDSKLPASRHLDHDIEDRPL